MNTKGKIMRKLLGQPTTNTVNQNVDRSNAGSPQLRPSASQNTIYSAGAPIACLDRSSDGQRAVIAGQKVFKILKIDGSTITEEIDLRSILTSYARTHDRSAASSEQLDIGAVAWSHGTLDSTIITASGNDRITVYDINRAGEGLEVARIQEHIRQVHKLAINPSKCTWLLSASQDGTVKSFDLRTPLQGRNGPIFGLGKNFKCNADAVRDVKWNPTSGYYFACCTETGVIQQWDARRSGAPVLKLSAHPGACSSISYHPDGDHLVSGGMDQLCHVWDVSKTAQRNQKPKFTFSTSAAVSRVSWRPACWSATAQGKRAAQITISYDDSSSARNRVSNIHIWDLARPHMPFKEIEHREKAPTGLIWNTRDILWTVDKEGHFTQTDVAFVPKLIDQRSLSSFAFSPTGDVLMMLEERQAPRRHHRPSITSPEISPSFHHGSSGPFLSVSRSDSEEDVVGSFLGARPKKGHHRRGSVRSIQPLSTTPPSNGAADTTIMSLDDAVRVTGIYKPQQVAAIGHAPSTANREMYRYFTNCYLQPMAEVASTATSKRSTDIRISSIMESYARGAEKVGHYRLAQTWRLLGYTIGLLLTRRAEHHRSQRLTSKKEASSEDMQKEEITESRTLTEIGEETPRKSPRDQTPIRSPINRGAISMILEDMESTSNVATPLVRPVRDSIAHETREAMQTPMVELKLPDAAHPTAPSPIPVPGARSSPNIPNSSIEGYDFYGMESFSPALDFVAPARKPPLRLDYPEQRHSPSRMQPQRHDSGESFPMFSTSGDSHTDRFTSSDGSDSYNARQQEGHSLRKRMQSWDSSLQSNSNNQSSLPSGSVPRSGGSEQDYNPDSREVQLTEQDLHYPTAPVFRLQEASAPLANHATIPKFASEERALSPTLSEMASEDPDILESDFLPWPNDPDFLVRPIDPTILVKRTLKFETQTGVLNAAAIVLLLRPFLSSQAMNEIQAGAILRQYHHRLICLKLFTEAALLRNLCVPTYPDVFSTAQESITVGYFCTDCQKPIDNDPLIPNSMWECPRCRKNIDACAICHQRDLDPTIEYEEEGTPLWWLCPGCGHGGHTACMQAWHSGPEFEEGDIHSNGCCPLEGCLHPCLPGNWRSHRAAENDAVRRRELDFMVRENARSNSGRGGVGRALPIRKDPREVNQSKAVEGVRVALVGSSLSGTAGGLERKKSVKLVAPGEET